LGGDGIDVAEAGGGAAGEGGLRNCSHSLTDRSRRIITASMKKIYCAYRKGKTSAIRRRCVRDLLWRQRKSQIRGGIWHYQSLVLRRGRVEFVRLSTPAILSLSDSRNRGELLRFLRQLRMVMLRGAGGVVVDFRATKTIYPTGGLLLFAEIDRIKRTVGHGRPMLCRPSNNEIVDQVLQQTGIYERFRHVSARAATDESVVHWRQATGVKVQGSDAGQMLENCEGKLAEPLKTGLYSGVTEAMTNSVQHAYIADREDGVTKGGEKRWWLFSQERDGILSFVICDLGIGIPKSLPKVNSGLKKLIDVFASDRADVESIRLASELGKTSTSAPYRGKGLPEILNAARESEQGACMIYSNRGQFGYGAGSQAVENQFSDSIYGTLIEWRVPITEGLNDVE
jgi:hypothetical protein